MTMDGSWMDRAELTRLVGVYSASMAAVKRGSISAIFNGSGIIVVVRVTDLPKPESESVKVITTGSASFVLIVPIVTAL